MYPDVNIAAGSIVSSKYMSFKAFIGKSTNWVAGISNPKTADKRGILNVLREIGIFCWRIIPFNIWHWGTVADMKGYHTPFAKDGEYKFEYPKMGAMLAISCVFLLTYAPPFKIILGKVLGTDVQ